MLPWNAPQVDPMRVVSPHLSAPPRIRRARPSDVAALSRLRVAAWNAAYGDLLPRTELRRITATRSAAMLRRVMAGPARGVLIAEAQGELEPLGYTIVGPQLDPTFPFRGEITELYVAPGELRQGIGSSLLRAAIWHLVDDRLNPVIVWVLARNPARAFYESWGASLIADEPMYFGAFATRRVAYGWSDALPLPERLR